MTTAKIVAFPRLELQGGLKSINSPDTQVSRAEVKEKLKFLKG